MRQHLAGTLALVVALCSPAAPQERSTPPAGAPRSVHAEQLRELAESLDLVTDDGREAATLERDGPSPGLVPGGTVAAAQTGIAEEFIVFGYLQSESQVFHTRWHALTHVGSLFVGFDATGNLTGTSAFTGRSSYLESGGAAQAAGTKVILVVNNFDDSPAGDIATVMTSPTLRAVLVADIVALLASDDYSHGVSLDLEFSWGTAVRDGITAFMGELRAALDALDPSLELSIYVNAIFSASQWDFDAQTGITPHVDYVLYSMYDWATGLTAHAISDFDNCLGATRMHGYLDDGLPPEKLVPTISAYSRRWNGTSVYDGVGSSSASSGFTDALYDVTLNPNAGGPYANTYVGGDEVGWYTWNDGIARTRTWESIEGMEYEIRHALSLQDASGDWNGRRLGGVGFWSLMWMAETSSIDPRTGGAVSRTRTYPHVYQMCEELLAPPGQERFTIDGFEGLDFRWRDPNESPDTAGDTDGDCARALVTTPGGAGAPSSSTNAMELTWDFEGAGVNTAVLAHEVLASGLAPSVTDLNATAGLFDATTELRVHMHAPSAAPGYEVRLLVVDADGELESSTPTALDFAGWRTVAWDLTDAAGVSGHTTVEPAFASGDGVLDTAGDGARDLGFYGFLVRGTGAAAGTLVVDEVTREHRNPEGRDYVVNELRYPGASGEFVEIHGPAGAFPAGLELRVYDGADGTIAKTIPLTGQIQDSGGGHGVFVVGDPGVRGVDDASAFGDASDDLADADPSGLQLFDTTTGVVYDSLVYEAFGGLDDLVRHTTRGVADNGFPWLGETATGTDVGGEPYSVGRYPDGADTRVNGDDFSFMPASPGRRNGGSVIPGSLFDFDQAPNRAFHTFGPFLVEDPAVAGLPSSPSGGLAWRCVDPAGGGVIGVVGDAALGATSGVLATGELYVPSAGAPAHAIAVGLGGRQGSRFFSSTLQDRSAYESGYWLVYETQAGVGLGDGRPDHPGVFELVHATHDNMDGEPTALLGSKTLAETGATAGAWTTFVLAVDPAAPPHARLVARINGVDVYRGPLPEGGPRSGAFQAGFRENHGGPPAADEGTWIDRLAIWALRPRAQLGAKPAGQP